MMGYRAFYSNFLTQPSDGCFSWGYTSFWVCSRANFTRGVAPFVVSPLQLIVTLDRVDLNYIIQFMLKNFKKILKNREMNVDKEKLIRESKEYFKNQTKRSWRSIKVNIEPSYVKEVSILFDEYFKLNHEEILLLILIRPLRNVMAHLENRKDPVKVRGIIRDFARREISNYTSILKKVMNKLLEIDWDIKEGERIIFSDH